MRYLGINNNIGIRTGFKYLMSGVSVSGTGLTFTVGTTKFTLGMMDDGNLGLYYTDTEELIRSWDAI